MFACYIKKVKKQSCINENWRPEEQWVKFHIFAIVNHWITFYSFIYLFTLLSSLYLCNLFTTSSARSHYEFSVSCLTKIKEKGFFTGFFFWEGLLYLSLHVFWLLRNLLIIICRVTSSPVKKDDIMKCIIYLLKFNQTWRLNKRSIINQFINYKHTLMDTFYNANNNY